MEIWKVEEELIAKVLIDQTVIVNIDLDFKDFYCKRSAKMYQHMLELVYEGIDIEVNTLRLKGVSLDEISYFLNIASKISTSAGVKGYCDMIRDTALKRKMSKTLQGVAEEMLYESGEKVLTKLEKAVVDLQESKYKKNKDKDIKTCVEDVQKQIAINAVNGRVGIPTGFKRLDEVLVGLVPASLITIGGATSVGKSTFLHELALRLARQGANGIVFSLEDSQDIKTSKLLCAMADVPYMQMVCADLNDKQKESFSSACNELKKLPIKIYDKCFTLPEIFLKTKKAMLSSKIDYIAVDYIQNIHVPGANNIYDQIREVVSFLYKMCKELNICVIQLSQISNEGKFKGAGEITAQSDTVIRLTREQSDMELLVEVEKNRIFGRTALGRNAIDMTFTETWSGVIEV